MTDLLSQLGNKNVQSTNTLARGSKQFDVKPNLIERPLRSEKSETNLPPINKDSLSFNPQKDVKLAYSSSGDLYKKQLIQENLFLQKPDLVNFVTRIQNVSMAPLSQRGLIINKKAEIANHIKRAKGQRRVRPPKTHFKIMKTNDNIQKLERVLTDFIDKNKTLKSSNDEIIMKPQNRMQAAINSLRAVNKILPKSNIVQHAYGYDEANLTKNHLILEKVMLERITKLKIRRSEEKLAKTKEPNANVENTPN